MKDGPIDFDVDVLARSTKVPVLVDFWAPWCGPCKMLGPVIERLAAQADGRWELVKVNTDEQQDIAARFQICGIPNLKFFHQGKLIGELSGALPEAQLKAWIAEKLPTPKREMMARARELLHGAQAADAARLLLPLAEANDGDMELKALAARALVFNKPAQALALINGLGVGGPWEDTAMIVREFARLLSLEVAARATPPASPLQARYLDGIRALRSEHFSEALTHFISVLEEKPQYDEGHLKSACVAVFRHLGLRHAVTEEFSRRFSMAVNV